MLEWWEGRCLKVKGRAETLYPTTTTSRQGEFWRLQGKRCKMALGGGCRYILCMMVVADITQVVVSGLETAIPGRVEVLWVNRRKPRRILMYLCGARSPSGHPCPAGKYNCVLAP